MRTLPAVFAGLLVALSSFAAGEPPASPREEIALLRFAEIREIGAAFDRYTWTGFNPIDYPAVIFEPGGPAVAIGFPAPPPGFHVWGGRKLGDRQIYRADPGTRVSPTGSLVRLAGTWSVALRIDPPRTLIEPGVIGRPSAEEELARYVGSATLLFLARQREVPDPPIVAGIPYPDDAGLLALAALEHRALLQAVRMNFTERNLEEFHETVRRLVAVRRARWAAMGPVLAAQEDRMENWEGLGMYAATLVHRHAASDAIFPTEPTLADATHLQYANSILLRLLITNYPLTRLPETPAEARALGPIRGAAMAFLLDRVSHPHWRPKAIPGERSLTDLLTDTIALPPEKEQETLEAARKAYGYDGLLTLAGDNLRRAAAERERLLGELFPADGLSLEIRREGGHPMELSVDPAGIRDLGGGDALQLGRLALDLAGLKLTVDESTVPCEAPAVLTHGPGPAGGTDRLQMGLRAGAVVSYRGRELKTGKTSRKTLSSASPLHIRQGRLDLVATQGVLEVLKEGRLVLTLP